MITRRLINVFVFTLSKFIQHFSNRDTSPLSSGRRAKSKSNIGENLTRRYVQCDSLPIREYSKLLLLRLINSEAEKRVSLDSPSPLASGHVFPSTVVPHSTNCLLSINLNFRFPLLFCCCPVYGLREGRQWFPENAGNFLTLAIPTHNELFFWIFRGYAAVQPLQYPPASAILTARWCVRRVLFPNYARRAFHDSNRRRFAGCRNWSAVRKILILIQNKLCDSLYRVYLNSR